MGRSSFGCTHKREFKINKLGSQEVPDSGAFRAGELKRAVSRRRVRAERVRAPSRLPVCQVGGCGGADPPGFPLRRAQGRPRNVRVPRKASPRGGSVTGARCVRERDGIRMCLDAAPRVISPSSLSPQAVPAAAGKAREVRAAPRLPRGSRPPAQARSGPLSPPQQRGGARAPSSPPARAPQHHPKADCEPEEPEGETAEREAEKRVGVRMYACVWRGGGQITCEWLEKNNWGRAWRGGSGNFPIKLSKSPSSPRQANDTAAPKLSASRSYKNLQVFNFLPIPDTSKGLQGGIGRDFFFEVGVLFFFSSWILMPSPLPPK
ncbi:uncharacterized protein LOC142028642 [Buteo buteo]|uniref:uncharacterized protein LOC142028642 n=1 Tax=Buteo buteo TaxID=30397 RepID=UPI003EB96F67